MKWESENGIEWDRAGWDYPGLIWDGALRDGSPKPVIGK